ncbi:entericidin A/B family lipoprotein [Guyparkeria sp. SCN-R1]|uniref:entericidin A/B family lipoprotein n=1 Tax=Guyparkeria sp. SCN-R1 TaxID=2341113 RepID=UPI00195714BD|nr:entericidin A/B family lipoprotein [Guyparkeria sp. SCN-R1]
MIHTFLKRLAMLIAMAGSLTLLAGCNTMEGLGQDTQELGESIEGEAAEHD